MTIPIPRIARAARAHVAVALLTAMLVAVAAGIDSHASAAAEEDSPLLVYVVNYPLQYFAKRIGGDLVDVRFPAPQDVDPATWHPAADVIAAYQGADLVLLNGAGYARWVAQASLRRATLVDTSAAFRDHYITIENAVTHTHGPGGDHAHDSVATAVWLDPRLATKQAQAIAEAFARERPSQTAVFRRGLKDLEDDLRALDHLFAAAAKPLGNTPLLAAHPVYDYAARRYGLNIRSLQWMPNVAPDARAWDAFATLRTSHPAVWMLWESPPAGETRRRLEESRVGSVVYAPCANVPAKGDFQDVMGQNASRLEAAFAGVQ